MDHTIRSPKGHRSVAFRAVTELYGVPHTGNPRLFLWSELVTCIPVPLPRQP